MHDWISALKPTKLKVCVALIAPILFAMGGWWPSEASGNIVFWIGMFGNTILQCLGVPFLPWLEPVAGLYAEDAKEAGYTEIGLLVVAAIYSIGAYILLSILQYRWNLRERKAQGHA